MHTFLLSRRCLTTIFGLGAVLLSGTAAANSPVTPVLCDVQNVGPTVPSGGSTLATTLPANLPSFFAESGWLPLPPIRLLDVSVEPPREVPLRVVPRERRDELSLETFVLLPPGSAGGEPDGTRSLFEPGHDYRFEYVQTCYQGEDVGASKIRVGSVTRDFRATPASPPPTSAGEIAEVGRSPMPGDEEEEGGYQYRLDFSFTPASDLVPWGYAYYGSISVDGETVGGPGVPFVTSIGADLAGPDGQGGRSSALTVTLPCRYDSAVDSLIERHTIQYVVSPIGFEGTPVVTNTLEVALECPGPGANRARQLSSGEGGVTSDGGGCAFASARGHFGAWSALAGLVGPAAFLARRRRRSNAR